MNLEKKEKKKILEKANVTGVGVGKKIKDGQKTDQECVTVFVHKKKDLTALNSEDVVPEEVGGKKTDVVEIGRVSSEETPKVEDSDSDSLPKPNIRHRPVHVGVSISPMEEEYAGTLGGIVFKKETCDLGHGFEATVSKPVLLSNNHILYKTNKLEDGKEIMQPAIMDGGKNISGDFGIATNLEMVPLKEKNNLGDMALAEPKEDIDFSRYQPGVGAPKQEVADVEVGDRIATGRTRTTGFRLGEVQAKDVSIKVSYQDKIREFDNQIVTSSVSKPGDSGSIGYLYEKHMDDRKYPFGLLFAGSDKISIFTPMDVVLEELGCSLEPVFEVRKKDGGD